MKKAIALLTIITIFLFSNSSLVYGEEVSTLSIIDVLVIPNSDRIAPTITSGSGRFLGRGSDSFATSGESLKMQIWVEYNSLSPVESVSLEFATPNGNETIDALNELVRWEFTKTFSDSDIGSWTLNKIVATDFAGISTERTFTDFTFHIFPSNYSYFSDQELIIERSDDFVKISLSEEVDPTTITTQSVLLYESQLNFGFGNNNVPYDLKQLTDYNITVSDDKKSFTVENNSSYLTSKKYHIIIKDTLKDLEGNILTNPKWINLKYVDN